MKQMAIIAASLIVAVSCSKSEGTYASSKKIDCIRTETTGWYTSTNEDTDTPQRIDYVEPTFTQEEWQWEKRKLTAINLYDRDGSNLGKVSFTYSGGNLTIKENRSAGLKTVFAYNGDRLNSIKWYMDGRLYSSSEVEHDGKKIGAIKTTIYRMDKCGEWLVLAPYAEHLSKKGAMLPAGKQEKDALYRENLHLTWTGDNITEVASEDQDGNQLCLWQFTYDTKKNPLCNFWTKQELGAFVLPLFGSKNNVTSAKMTSERNNDTALEYTYSYVYDGNYPSKQTRTDRNTPNSRYQREETITTEYIYK